ncbi:Alpha/Beta hydrolase protein [Melanogaster broomeanus]|nr:Alpha/Beta hydrolase protein [Melanogaster broomeanus]
MSIPIPHSQDLPISQPSTAVRSRTLTLDDRDGLQVYLFEALPSSASPSDPPGSLPLILLLHGFPELAYSWRKILAPLSEARGGYHVVAPDLRGYGRTQQGPAPFHVLNIVEDICALVHALGHRSVAMLVGHDFGSPVAGHCVLARPALFESVVFMSAPFTGVGGAQSASPSQSDSAAADSVGTATDKPVSVPVDAVATALEALTPPRKHYTAYFCTPDANREMLGARPEDLHSFLGGYYHMKSGAWEGNTARPLPSASNAARTVPEVARDLAALPEYYVMPLGENMRQVITRHARQDPRFAWPLDDDGGADAGAVYTDAFARTGFQGALNYYRCALAPPPPERVDELVALSGRRVSIPAAFIAGARDWGVYQTPGAVEKTKQLCGMESEDLVLIEGAGHWVQQEAPERVIAELLRFLGKIEKGPERAA